jgi:DNA-binding response OmpR family regulator
MAGVSLWLVIPDAQVSEPWRRLTSQQGWDVSIFPDIEGFTSTSKPHQVGLALIDWTCLRAAPTKLLQSVKTKVPHAALLVTTASDIGSAKTIEILEAGVDDYLVRPMHPDLFLAKMRAHLRRILPSLAQAMNVIRTPRGDIKMDLARRDVWMRHKGKWVRGEDLTDIEMKLLGLFLERPGVAVERGFILESLWREKGDDIRPGTIDKHVEALRRKLGAFGSRIRTVYGVGYEYRE